MDCRGMVHLAVTEGVGRCVRVDGGANRFLSNLIRSLKTLPMGGCGQSQRAKTSRVIV